jgi:hypothetical protein
VDDFAALRRLVVATVQVAVVDIRSLASRQKENPNAAPRKRERSALTWIQDTTSHAPFTLRWCCELIDPDFRKAQACFLSWLPVPPQTEATRN